MCAKNDNVKLLLLHCKTENQLTVGKKMSSDLFKNVMNKMCLQIIYLVCMDKHDLALNNLEWLICHKTQPTNLETIWMVLNY